jgi:hypothetical protein
VRRTKYIGRNARRARAGFSFAEVASTSFLIVLLAIFILSICLLIFGCSVNDQACRDAVRAAAQQLTPAQATSFAQASVANHKTDGFFIGTIQLANVNYNDFGGTPPVGQCPYVQVTTKVQVTLPVPLYFFGASFTNQFTFAQTYTSPIIKVKYSMP